MLYLWLVIYRITDCNTQAAVESLSKANEEKASAERLQSSLSEELARAQRESSSANQKVKRDLDVWDITM